MTVEKITTLEQIRSFLSGTSEVLFEVSGRKQERYDWVRKMLIKFGYPQQNKEAKGDLFQFMMRISRFSRAQLSRLIAEHRKTGKILHQPAKQNNFKRKYTAADIALLVKVDRLNDYPSGGVVKKICERMYHQFSDQHYVRLATISVSQIYLLRNSPQYQRHGIFYKKTQATKVAIGKRKKPKPEGHPGYIRIDTVHQGDEDKQKGVYHINAVDEVTQYQVTVCVELISERYLLPALERLLAEFPFKLHGFHSDNGSEYINYTVARLLEKLLIEMTKSRAYKSGDNALVESKNGSSIRKCFGHGYIPKIFSEVINVFNQNHLVPYLNFHKPCYFSDAVFLENGKCKKRYLYKNMMTPYEKFKSLPQAEQYLKEGITFALLDVQANAQSDIAAAVALQEARNTLFALIHAPNQ